MATTAARDRAPASLIRTCRQCGGKNRVPAARLADQGRCGACKAALPPIDEPIDANQTLFDAVVNSARVPVLVDFWAAWCGPCRMAAPEVKKVAAANPGRAIVLKVDTEKETELAGRYGITSIPSFLVFRGGQLATQQAGLMDQGRLQALIEGS